MPDPAAAPSGRPRSRRSRPGKQEQPSVADVLGSYLAEQCRIALDGAEQIAAATRAVEDVQHAEVPTDLVHRTRVALRRFRSILRVFADAFSVPEAGRISDDAGWFADRLGSVRDLDVLQVRIQTAIADLDEDLVVHDPAAELDAQIRYRRGIALAAVESATRSETYADLVDQLRSWQRDPPWSVDAAKPATKIKKYVKRADQRLSRRLERAARAVRAGAPETDELIHRARRAAKRHRYAVEAAAIVLGPSAAKVVRSRADLQDRLGELTDSVLACGFLRDLGGIPGRNGFTFGVLHSREVEHRRRTREAIAALAR